MNFLYAPALRFMLVALTLFSCAETEKLEVVKEVTVSIQATNLLSDTVSIVKYNMLNHQEISLAEVILDDTGIGTVAFELTAPTFAALSIKVPNNDQPSDNELYLSPGDDLQVTVDGKDVNHTIQYQGTGADANNYLAQSSLVRQRYFRNGGKFIWELETDDFLNRLDSIGNDVSVFHQQYTDTASLTEPLQTLMQKKNEMELTSTKYEYAFLMHNNSIVDALINDRKVDSFVLPEPLMNIDNEVPFDTTFLKLGVKNYAYLLENYLTRSIMNPFFVGKTQADLEAFNSEIPVIVDSLLRAHQLPADFQGYFLAKNVDEAMTRQGISSSVDIIYHAFKEKNADSQYLPFLEERYNRWLAIKPGTSAPHFYGTTPEGKKLALSDLRGNVVYIDVWATWCRPCIEEFPASQKLQQQFADHEEVVFLYISIDNDQSAWNKFLKKHPDLKGTHILDTAPQDESIWKKYMLSGLPRYLLINQVGDIVSTDADRPSSGKVKGQIDALLNAESTVEG